MATRLPLDRGWKYWWTDYFGDAPKLPTSLSDVWQMKARDADVPGMLQCDLMRDGDLPDIYYGDNVDHALWMESRDWWYGLEFNTPADVQGKRAFLVFHGLDTFAEIRLNGKVVGKSDNMFIRHRFEVTSQLAASGQNLLVVRLSPVKHMVQVDPSHQPLCWSPERLFCRKAQMSFGWDIAPRILTVGIWRPVELDIEDAGRLASVWVRLLDLKDNRATVRIQAEVEWLAAQDGKVRLRGTLHDRSWEMPAVCRPGMNVVEMTVTLKDPPLWWPLGYGEQKLIPYSVALEDANGRVLDECSGRTGLRRVELVQEPQASGGTSFRFRCNGEDLLITGLNWTPADSLFSRVTAGRYTSLLERVAGIGCNMMRVWGGGVYEQDHFYSECDRLGIFIWQDFMMACGWYPQDDTFAEKLDIEARQVVRDLRNHPCIALWAGDNEVDAFYPPLQSQNRLTRQTLAGVCLELDPDRPYIPSSPYDPQGLDPSSRTRGDVHCYRHGTPYTAPELMDLGCRFLSEFGQLSLPSLELIHKYFPAGTEWPITSRMWKFHGADTIRLIHPRDAVRILRALRGLGGPEPQNIEEAVKASQELQSDAVCTWIERYCADPEFGGFLLWNVTDCWPQQSDSIIDWGGTPKAIFAKLGPLFAKVREQRRSAGAKAGGGKPGRAR